MGLRTEGADAGGDFLPTAGGELKGTLQINGTQADKIDPLLCKRRRLLHELRRQ